MSEQYPALRYGDGMWEECKDGVWTVECDSWEKFVGRVGELKQYRYVWRGQRCDEPLLPSIYRDLCGDKIDQHLRLFRRTMPNGNVVRQLLKRAERDGVPEFKQSLSRYLAVVRPKRSDNDPKNDTKDFIADVYWAIGQHHGLKTPLLDWSEDPYRALFFAFCGKNDKDGNRIVFALAEKSRLLLDKNGPSKRHIEFLGSLDYVKRLLDSPCIPHDLRERVVPMFDRIKAQKGLFTRTLYNESIEKHIRKCYGHYKDHRSEEVVFLVRIVLPDGIRKDVLRKLERKKISFKAMYPDIQGAALHSNLKRELQT